MTEVNSFFDFQHNLNFIVEKEAGSPFQETSDLAQRLSGQPNAHSLQREGPILLKLNIRTHDATPIKLEDTSDFLTPQQHCPNRKNLFRPEFFTLTDHISKVPIRNGAALANT